MAEVPDANEPPDRSGQGGQNGAPYQQRQKFKKNSKQKQESMQTSFKCPLPEYETYVYDIYRNKGSDAFSATTHNFENE